MNYYKELDVDERADQESIKKSYRKLCMKWHPDKNNNSEESTDKFKRLNEAYDILGDPEKRKMYDLTRKNPFMNMNMDVNHFSGTPGFGPINPNDIFDMLFDIHNIDGDSCDIPIPGGCAKIFTNIGKSSFPFKKNKPIKPEPIFQTVNISFENAYTGCNIPIKINRWVMYSEMSKVEEQETVYLDIPKGVDHDEIFEIKKKGNVISKGDLRGDVKIRIEIIKHDSFQRNGLDLIYYKNITLKEALCGFSFELSHLNGNNYNINNNSGNIIGPDEEKRIPKMGFVRDNSLGNLIIKFKILFPEKITDENISKLKEIL